MDSTKTLGVTPPLSSNMPTATENRATDALMEELTRQKTFESEEDTAKRKVVLASLQEICDAFVKKVAREKEPNNSMLIRNARGKVFTYGSYRLGVFGPGSDIDTLVVAPKYVTRDDYFKEFPNLLLSMAPKDTISDMAVVTDAFVPIIKFEYSNISIDLIFSRVFQKEITQDFDLKDMNILRGLDEAELRSLNGTRVTDEILDLVPEQGTFKRALRAIKLWAQRRAVYANIMGFPGGVAWAMMVARVCQLYPKATASVIVNKFFLVIAKWQWPQPVLLKPVESGPLPVRIWNPKIYKGDTFHLMPVITPAYPSMCSTFNITRSSKAIIQKELGRAFEITEQVMVGKRPWSDLFQKHTFFTSDYKYYMTVVTTSRSKEDHKIWSGYVESKVRVLVMKVEAHASISLARPFNKGYERRHLCSKREDLEKVQDGSLQYVIPTKNEINAVQGTNSALTLNHLAAAELPPIKKEESESQKGGDLQADNALSTANGKVGSEQQNGTKDEQPSTAVPSQETLPDGPFEVFTTTHYIGLQLAQDAKSLDLSYEVDEFKALCTGWQKYVDDLTNKVSLGVQHVKSINLPDDLFEPGEERPCKKSGTRNTSGKKRGHQEDVTRPTKRQQASATAVG